MEDRKPLSFFKNARKRVLESETLRFLLFIERVPKHRVLDGISILFLAFLSIGCFGAGLAGFIIWQNYTFLGFLLYYVGVLSVMLELLHCIFDR